MSGSIKSRLPLDTIAEILRLHDFEFLSFEAISKRLKIPNRTVQDAYNEQSKHNGYSLYRALKEDAKCIRNPRHRAQTLEWIEANRIELFRTPGTYLSNRQIRQRTVHETIGANDLRSILSTASLTADDTTITNRY